MPSSVVGWDSHRAGAACRPQSCCCERRVRLIAIWVVKKFVEEVNELGSTTCGYAQPLMPRSVPAMEYNGMSSAGIARCITVVRTNSAGIVLIARYAE